MATKGVQLKKVVYEKRLKTKRERSYIWKYSVHIVRPYLVYTKSSGTITVIPIPIPIFLNL